MGKIVKVVDEMGIDKMGKEGMEINRAVPEDFVYVMQF